MKEQYSVSVKGILYHQKKQLLRLNQRQEYELLGGKLCHTDKSIVQRLKTEFLEESGISVEILDQREPWVYVIGAKPVLILPHLCRCETIPSDLYDQDGGKLSWVNDTELCFLNIPNGYVDSIRNELPRISYSPSEGEFPVYIPNYVEDQYAIQVALTALDGHMLFSAPLQGAQNPRNFLAKLCHAEGHIIYSQAVVVDKTVVLKFIHQP